MHGKDAPLDGVGKLFGGCSLDFHVDFSHHPLAHRLLRQRVGEVDLQTYMLRHLESVGTEGGVRLLVEVVTIITEILVDARALGIKDADIKGITRLYQRLCGGNSLIFLLWEMQERDGVNAENRSEVHFICNLCRPWTCDSIVLGGLRLAFYDAIVDVSTEIAMILQHCLSHAGAQFGIDITHQYGRFAEGAVEPASQGILFAVAGIVNPEGIREWSAII